MQLKVQEVGNGFYPQEVLVEIRSVDGDKRMLIDKRAIEGSTVKIGSPITARDMNASFLVELPRETTGGEWRIWVSADQLAGA